MGASLRSLAQRSLTLSDSCATVPAMPPKTYLSSAEVCTRLDIDRSTLSRWVTAKKLTPVMRVGNGGAFLFDPKDIARIEQAAA